MRKSQTINWLYNNHFHHTMTLNFSHMATKVGHRPLNFSHMATKVGHRPLNFSHMATKVGHRPLNFSRGATKVGHRPLKSDIAQCSACAALAGVVCSILLEQVILSP